MAADTRTDATIVVGADTTQMEVAFAKMQALVKARMESIASSVKTSLSGVAEAIAGAFAFKEVKDLVNGVAEAQAHLQQLSEVAGTSVESLSAIQSVAKVTGTSMDDVSAALVKLTKGLATGDGETGKAANALAYLGISARNSDGSLRDSGELYTEVAKKFVGIGNGAGKTALALDLFGKAGAAQIPVLNALGEAGGGMVKLTEEQGRTAEDYERNLNRLSIQMQVSQRIIATGLIPVADDFVRSLLAVISGTNGVTKSLKELATDGSLEEFGRNAAIVAASVVDAFVKVGQTFKFVQETIGAGAAEMFADSKTAAAIDADYAARMSKMFSGPTLEEQLRKQFAVSDEAKKIDFGSDKAAWDKSTYTGTGHKTRLEDTSKAEFAVAKAQFEAALALQKEYLKEAQEGYDDAYKHNLIGIREYYDDRIATEQAMIQKDIDTKNFEIAANQKAQSTAATDRERLTLKAEEIKLTGQLTVLTAQYANVVVTETRAMTEAERERADALREVQIASQINIGNSQVAMDRIALDTRKALRQESNADAIAEERAFEDRLTAIQADAIRQRIALEAAGHNDPTKIAAMNAQLEDLERTHQEKLTQLDAEATIERNKYATAAAEAIQGTFTTFLDDLQDRTKKLKDVFKDFFQGIQRDISSQISKRLSEQVLGAGSTGGGILNDALSKILPGLPAKKATDAAGGGSVASSSLASLSTSATKTAATLDTQTDKTNTLTSALDDLISAVNDTTDAMGGDSSGGGGDDLGDLGDDSGGGGGDGASLGDLAGVIGKAGGASGMGSFVSWFQKIGGAFLDSGTDFVPKDMLAMIHKGERITPAAQNRSGGPQGATINLSMNVPGGTNRASANQAARQAGAATSAALARFS